MALLSSHVRALLLGAASVVLAFGWAAPVSAQTESRPPGDASLRPGDVVRIDVWREPEWSDTFPVSENGAIVLPRLGPVQVQGIGTDSLRRFLIASYARYLRNPSVAVTLLRRIRVSGAVSRPGLYPVDPTITIADAIAMAGGATSNGKVDKVELLRDNRRIEIKLDQSTRLADTPVQSGDALYVPERGWLARNTWVFATLLSAATALALTAAN